MILGIPVYQGVDLLDVAGPYEMFNWVESSKGLKNHHPFCRRRSSKDGEWFPFRGAREFRRDPALDVLWVPGGAPEVLGEIMSDPTSPYLAYLRQVAAGARWVCSVCEGALLLARAGLLDGHKATTHWAFVDCLQRFPGIDVDTTNQRFIESGNRLTGGGISSGLDEALKLIALLFDEETAAAVQVSTQYFPKPPIKGCIPAAPPCMVRW